MKPTIIIRKATKDDAPGKGFVHYTSWIETYTGLFAPKYMEKLSLERSVTLARDYPENTFVALIDDSIVGFACYNEARDEDLKNTGEVRAIYVLKEYHHKGIGTALMKACYEELSDFDDIIVWVLGTNQSSKDFYMSHGFIPDGATKELYDETLIRMIQIGQIHTCSSRYTLDRIYDFFFEELNFNQKNEGYVRRRKDELESQYTRDPELILYISHQDHIVSAISMKHKDDTELTMAMLATTSTYQNKGLAKRLVHEIERLAKHYGYSTISLGARTSACGFYIKMSYTPALLIQAFGTARQTEILSFNDFYLHLPLLDIIETNECDYIFLETDHIDETIITTIKHQFEEIDVQYIFTKTLKNG